MRNGDGNITLTAAAALFCTIFLLVIGFVAGYALAVRTAHAGVSLGKVEMPPDVDFSPVWKAWGVINEKFVPAAVSTSTPLATSTEKLNQEKVWGMIQGLAGSLNDPYTFFMPPSESKQFASDMKGSFEGVGMEIDVKDGVLTIVSPLKGTPASRAGLKSGDQILEIDGISTEGMDSTAAVNKIRGPKGSAVVFTIQRAGWSEPRKIKVIRDVINVPIVVTTERPDGIFEIQLITFTANAPDLFRSALREFVQSGRTKLILDMRGNPGGYLEAAVDMGSWFLPSGAIIVTEDYAGHAHNIVHRSLGYNIFNKNLQMIILIDRGSASASEILAGALRYQGVATLVGSHTYGKGSVQELVEITPDTSLKITVARWLGPDGSQIPREGIAPNYEVALSDEDRIAGRDPQLDKAIELLGGTLTASSTSAQ